MYLDLMDAQKEQRNLSYLKEQEQPLTPPPSIEQGRDFSIPDTQPSHEQERMTEEPGKDQEKGFLDDAIQSLRGKLRKPKKDLTAIPITKDELTIQVEKIMEDGLSDAFLALTPVQKQEFKIKGEQTAIQIRQLLSGTKIKLKKVFILLVGWLKFLPGVNKFFIEQEAKIKADKIAVLHRISRRK